jgi:hypothetical protein
MMKFLKYQTIGLVAGGLFLIGCAGTEPAETDDNGGQSATNGSSENGGMENGGMADTMIRVFHGSPAADGLTPAGVDVVTGGAAVATGLTYTQGTDWLTVPAGDYSFEVFATGADYAMDTPAISIPSLSYDADRTYTAVAYDDNGTPSAIRIEDDVSAPAAGKIRVRAIHIADGVGQVDIWNITDAENPAALFADVDFAMATASAEIDAQAYTLGFDVDNDAVPDLTFAIPALAEGTVANLFAVIDAEGVKIVAQLDGATTVVIPADAPVDPPAENTSIRVFHGSPAADGLTPSGVDVVTGGNAVATALTYTNGTEAVVVPAGDYAFDVFATGADYANDAPAISIPSLSYEATKNYTAVAYDDNGTPSAIRIEDDLSAPATGKIRVRAIHIADGVGQVDIWNFTDPDNPAPVFVDVDFGAATEAAEVDAAAMVLGFDVNDDAKPDVMFDIPALAAGTVANLFAVADADGVKIVAQLDGATTVAIPASTTDVRFAHLSPDAPAVDIYVRGQATPIIDGGAYTTHMDYAALPSGVVTLDVYADGTDLAANPAPAPVISIQDFYLEGGKAFTLAAIGELAGGSAEPLSVTALEDDVSAPGAAQIRVRAFHAAVGVGQVDIWNITDANNPTPLIVDFDFAAAGENLILPAETALVLGIDVNNDALPEFEIDVPGLPAGTVANLYAVADTDGVALIADIGNDGAAMTRLDATGASYVRVVHASKLANDATVAGVDVFLDGQTTGALVTALGFQTATGALVVESGDYAFDIYATGDTAAPALEIPSLSYGAGGAYALVAYDAASAINPLRIEEDFTSPTAGTARVQVVHVANGVGEVDVYNTASIAAPLVPDLGFEGSATTEVPAGTYSLGIDVDNDAGTFEGGTFTLPALADGDVVTVYAINDGLRVELMLHLRDGTFAVVEPN